MGSENGDRGSSSRLRSAGCPSRPPSSLVSSARCREPARADAPPLADRPRRRRLAQKQKPPARPDARPRCTGPPPMPVTAARSGGLRAGRGARGGVGGGGGSGGGGGGGRRWGARMVNGGKVLV